MSEAYDLKLRSLARDVAEELGIQLAEGVYSMQTGPCYESVTECKLLRLLGADVTGEREETLSQIVVVAENNVKSDILFVLFASCTAAHACSLKFDIALQE